MYPPKLKKGDEVRIIAPSRSLALPWISEELTETARARLEGLGLKVSFGKYVHERDEFDSTTIEHRIEDLHAAFADDSVKLVLTVIGGFNCNQLLKYIDYEFIKNHPKILCGYSDITALGTAIYAKTGLVTYSGPHFFNFGQKLNFAYTLDHFQKCFFDDEPIPLHPSTNFVDDWWATKQDDVELRTNNGWTVLQEGEAKGEVFGGNLGTFHLLQGTEYMPNPQGDVILFIEDDREDHPAAFDRNLQSLLHQDFANRIRGVVIGRCEEKSGVTIELLRKIIGSKKELRDVPIVAGLDFGHTTPMFTFPIGGTAAMTVSTQDASITIIQH